MKSVALLAAAVLLVVGTGPSAAAAEPSYDGTLVPVSGVGATTPLAKPTLRAGGPALIVSDSPEPLSEATALPGALYRDQVEGLVRVLGHQQNNRTTPVQNSVAVTNAGDQLTAERGIGESPLNCPVELGMRVWWSAFKRRYPDHPAAKTFRAFVESLEAMDEQDTGAAGNGNGLDPTPVAATDG